MSTPSNARARQQRPPARRRRRPARPPKGRAAAPRQPHPDRRRRGHPRSWVAGIIFFAVKAPEQQCQRQPARARPSSTARRSRKGTNNASATNPWGVLVLPPRAKPTLAIWEDFQCPICARRPGQRAGRSRSGCPTARSTWFRASPPSLDQRFASTSPNPYSSYRAGMVHGCAIDAGQVKPYRTFFFLCSPTSRRSR